MEVAQIQESDAPKSDIPIVKPYHSDEKQPDNLKVSIENYLKHGDSMFDSHVVFSVVTKTTRDAFPGNDFQVYRRYSDFIWLVDALRADFPFSIIPPLPPKEIGKLNKFDSRFLQIRKRSLERFLRILAITDEFSATDYFIQFCSAKSHEFATIRNLKLKSNTSKLSDSVAHLTTRMLQKEQSSRHVEMLENAREDSQKLQGLSTKAESCADLYTQVSSLYRDLAVEVTSMCESDTDAKQALTILHDSLQAMSAPLKKLGTSVGNETAQLLRDLSLVFDSVKTMLLFRADAEYNHQYVRDSLAAKEKDLASVQSSDQKKSIGSLMGKSPEEVKREKMESLNQQIKDLKTSLEEAEEQLQTANGTVDQEWQLYMKSMHEEVLAAVGSMALAHATFHDEAVKVWGDAEAKFQALLDEE